MLSRDSTMLSFKDLLNVLYTVYAVAYQQLSDFCSMHGFSRALILFYISAVCVFM